MSYQGRYSQKKPAKAQKPASKGKKIVLILLLVLVLLIAAVVVAAVIYINSMLSLMTEPKDVSLPSMSDEEIEQMLNPSGATASAEDPTVETTIETSPEDTWPEIVSDENITNILVVGQAAREGEEYRLSDSMILCTINRETKTLTMTSFMRDMYVTIPAYAGHTQGANRINVCYHLGSYWTGTTEGGMEMLELCIEKNFGIDVHHTIEVDFQVFQKIINLVGGVDVELSEAELEYMQCEGNNLELQVGMNHLDGVQALMYARMRKIDSDYERTGRQREIVTSIIENCRNLGLMELHSLFTEVLPMITTNMTNSEITNYAFEFLPMVKDLQIVSQTCPIKGTYWGENIGTEDVPDYVLKFDTWANKKLLQETCGAVEAE